MSAANQLGAQHAADESVRAGEEDDGHITVTVHIACLDVSQVDIMCGIETAIEVQTHSYQGRLTKKLDEAPGLPGARCEPGKLFGGEYNNSFVAFGCNELRSLRTSQAIYFAKPRLRSLEFPAPGRLWGSDRHLHDSASVTGEILCGKSLVSAR